MGPFENVGTRGDDPNDVIPHEDRREIRANRLLAAWLNHFDSRSANSLDMLVGENGRKFVKHLLNMEPPLEHKTAMPPEN